MRLTVSIRALFSMASIGLFMLLGCSQEAGRGPVANSPQVSQSEAFHDSSETLTRPAPDLEASRAPNREPARPTKSAEETAETAPVDTEESAPEAVASDSTVSSPEAKPQRLKKAEKEVARKRRRQEIQSGLLTAGSFDDVANFASYQKFLNKILQQDAGEHFPRWAIGKSITLSVRAGGGSPLGNAKVEIREVEQDQQQTRTPLATVITGSDGRAILLTGEDNLSGKEKVSVRITAPGSEPLERIVSLSESDWNFTLSAAQSQLPQQLDLALVIDTTGSMGDELEYLKVEIDNIATTIKSMFPQVQQRYALVLYRDEGDQYVTRTFDFTSSLADFRGTLSSQTAGGGGDYPEAMHLAMEHASQLDWRTDNTARVMFLVGDAPPHQNYARRALTAGLKLRRQGVRVYPLGASGVKVEAEFIMRAIAFATVGQYLFLTDHSGIGNAHATPHVPEFQVERLDRLMVRMIAGELAGKRLVPREVIAIEQGDLQTGEGAPPEPIEQQTSQWRDEGWNQPMQAACVMPTEQSAQSAASYFSGIPAWLMFVCLIVSVFCIDVWDKHHPTHQRRREN